MERICSPQARQLPRPTSPPASHPHWGLPGRLGEAALFVLLRAAVCPVPSAAPGGLLAGIGGGCPVLSALDAQPSEAGGAGFIPEGLSLRAAEGGGGRGPVEGGARPGGAPRDPGKPNPPGFIACRPPAKVRDAHLEPG